jgi:hypothetical protein
MLLHKTRRGLQHAMPQSFVGFHHNPTIVLQPVAATGCDRGPHEAYAEGCGRAEHRLSAIPPGRRKSEDGRNAVPQKAREAITQGRQTVLCGKEIWTARPPFWQEMQKTASQEIAPSSIDYQSGTFMGTDVGVRTDLTGDDDAATRINSLGRLARKVAADVHDRVAANCDDTIGQFGVTAGRKSDDGPAFD